MSELASPERRRSELRRAAVRLALRHYAEQLRITPLRTSMALGCPALGVVFLNYLPPLVIASIVRDVVAGEPLYASSFTSELVTFAVLLAIGEALWRIGIHNLNRMDAHGIERLFDGGLDKLLQRDLAFFHDNLSGSLTKRVVSYAKMFEEFGDALAFRVVGSILPLGVAVVVLGRYSPVLVLALLGLLVVTGALVAPLILRRQVIVDDREEASATVAGHIADTITNVDAVRSHAAEHGELVTNRRHIARHRALNVRSWDFQNLRIDGVTATSAVVMNTAGLALALQLGAGHGVDAVVVTFTYFLHATRVVFEFNQTYRQLESSISEAAQLTELLLTDPTVVDPDVPEPCAPADASVRFDRVTFAYLGRPTLFRDLDLVIESGEKVGFVGRSGGGKTTLTRLLLRHMDITRGRILVGGQDIARLRQADLRAQLAYVPQDPLMFHRSLRDNIAFGRQDADDDDIRRAALAAHAAEFIEELPLGYETLVGERGVKLSGGQRQRVAIARAILRNAPILLLDEATSALDSESEALIQDALLHLLAERTAIVVAHRLSTVARMDRLVVFEGGRVVEQGSHDQLLDQDGVYSGLWSRQAGGFLADSAAG